MTLVFMNGKLIHEERIIVGQSDQQTPVFSDRMEKIVFKPQWGVPNSIKITDLLPRLRSGDTGVLERRGMKIVENGRTISPDRIRWSSTDIRYLSIVQGPGPRNPLGEMKFMFPNHHSVYMHDTTSKHLFRSSSRTFSHGCIRVRNPRKLAQVIFEDVQGWDVNRIPKLLDRNAKENNEIYLDEPIAVHNVYFTLVPDGRGGFYRLTDVYGHDKRIIEALEGKSLEWLADNDPARIHKQRVADIERSTRYRSPSYPSPSRRQAFSNDGATFFLFGSSLGAPPPVAAKPKRKARRRTIQPAWPPLFLYD
jgi:murein L,D-transpeptidase YcbB/YkuD